MAARVGSLASVLPIALVEPDGLIVTTDGRYVRVIECDRVPNTITADPSELARIESCFAHLCRIVRGLADPDAGGELGFGRVHAVLERRQVVQKLGARWIYTLQHTCVSSSGLRE